ncbi:MAG: ABC transporter permease [Pseudomonadota bacterium]
MPLFSISLPALAGQLTIGLINGALYATLSLGMAIIFGLLRVVNFAHGALYMAGAYVAWIALDSLGLGYGWALLLAPLLVGAAGALIERTLLRRVYGLDPLYGLLLTFGIALVLEGGFRQAYGTSGQPYAVPAFLGGRTLLAGVALPNYRLWVVGFSLALCGAAWLLVERTRLGAYLRAATEDAALVRAFGVRVPRLLTFAYAFGAALAALGGVLAAPIYQVNALMGSQVIVVVFAIVVIGGLGSLGGAIAAGFLVGVVEGLAKYFYPEASGTVVFLLMVAVLAVRPAGLFGRDGSTAHAPQAPGARRPAFTTLRPRWVLLGIAAGAALAPMAGVYEGFVLKALCLGLFAASFNLLVGFGGLMSFGHAAFFGAGAYATGHALRNWGWTPECAIGFGVAAGAALGGAFGWLAIRRQGIYFAMVTLALAQMFYFFCLRAPFTGGEDGLRDIPRGMAFGLLDLDRPGVLYAFVVAAVLLGFALIGRIVRSPFGHVLAAVKQNEARAISLGYSAARCKWAVFVLSAALAAFAGALKVLAFQIVTLTDAHWATSGEVVLMTLLGGLGTFAGPLVGAVVLVAIGGYLASLGSWVAIVQGLVFIVCVLGFRSGIAGFALQAFHSIRTRRQAHAVQPVSRTHTT